MVDSSKEFSGVYILRTTSQHCCEMKDEKGNVFSAFTNGEIKVTQGADDDATNSKTMKGEGVCICSYLFMFEIPCPCAHVHGFIKLQKALTSCVHLLQI